VKPKLFINSTDVADMTGYSLRNARNIMNWIRTELQLDSKQVISIFDFCVCFRLPVEVVYRYINNDFKDVPLDEFEIRRCQSQGLKGRDNEPSFIDMSQFEPFIHKERVKYLNKDRTTVETNSDEEQTRS